MENSFVDPMEKIQKGSKPAIHLGPFLPLARIKERGLSFNDIMKDPQAMTEAALMNYKFGFESMVLPYDLHVEAEILGATVQYHEGFDGHSVYPTIAQKPFTTDDDIDFFRLRPRGFKRKAGRSGMTGDCHVPICGGVGVRFPCTTRLL